MISAANLSNRKLNAEQIISVEKMAEICRRIALANNRIETQIVIGEGVAGISSLFYELTKAEVSYLRLHGYYVSRNPDYDLILISWRPR